MVIIIENDRVSFAAPISSIERDEAILFSDAIKPDNLPFWKIKGSKNALMAGWARTRGNDAVRYQKGLFEPEINVKNLAHKTMPKLQKIMEDEELIENEKGRWLNFYYVAQGNKVYEVYHDCVIEMEDYESIGPYCDIALSSLERTKGLDRDERLRILSRECQTLGYGALLPMAVMDTKTRKIKILK